MSRVYKYCNLFHTVCVCACVRVRVRACVSEMWHSLEVTVNQFRLKWTLVTDYVNKNINKQQKRSKWCTASYIIVKLTGDQCGKIVCITYWYSTGGQCVCWKEILSVYVSWKFSGRYINCSIWARIVSVAWTSKTSWMIG